MEKKVPGKGWEYMVYDKQDRLIMSQDANMGSSKQWLFTKYDLFGRVLYTGIYTGSQNYGSPGREAEQTLASTSSVLNESRSTAGFDANGMTAYYTNSAYPAAFTKILTVNYYDTYLPYGPARPAQIMGENTIGDNVADAVNTQALPTVSMVKNIEDDNWTKSYIWYDTKRRPVGAYSVNHLGGYTSTESSLDFAGLVQQSKAYHKRLSSDTEKIITHTYEYDSQNRLKKQWHQVNGQPQELLSENFYNELSQLTRKKVGNSLQSIDYTYNIRGARTGVNDPADLGTDLFAYSLSYFDPINTATGKYSNNVSEVTWKTSQDNTLRKYSYEYDALNRMKKGIYSEPNSSVPQNDFYSEAVTYDMNSNILSLQRNGKNSLGLKTEIDALKYVYANNSKSNRLISVIDSSTNYSGYPDTSGTLISYDDNGNMKDHKDKGILQIDYNYLNLPDYLKFNSGLATRTGTINENTAYLYRADGIKLRKTYNFAPYNPLGTITQLSSKVTEYLDGFQYEGTAGKKGAVSLLALKFVPTSEGYYNFENNQYIYNYTDHLGNVRLSYFKNTNGSAEVLEENNFYPFGMKHEGYNALEGNPAYNYQYNSKELQQETGWSDYGARMYMSDIGRWGVVDPLAEKMTRHSPYNYAFNNPVMFIDPDGMAPGQIGWMDKYGHWEFDPNTTLMGGDFFAGMNYSTQMSFWQDAAGGGSGFLGSQMYKDIMAYLAEPEANYFQGIDFSKLGLENLDDNDCTKCPKKAKDGQMYNDVSTGYQYRNGNWVALPAEGSIEYKGQIYFNPTPHYITGDVPFSLGSSGGLSFLKYSSKALKSLISTEKGAQSAKKISDIATAMKNGNISMFSEPIHTYLYNGKTYILDGHHRIKAAIKSNQSLEIIQLNMERAIKFYKHKIEEIHKGLH